MEIELLKIWYNKAMEKQKSSFREGEPSFSLRLPDLSQEVVAELKNHLSRGEAWETAEVGLDAGKDLAALYDLFFREVNPKLLISLNAAFYTAFPEDYAEALGRFGFFLVFDAYNKHTEKTENFCFTDNLKNMKISYQDDLSRFEKWFIIDEPAFLEDISETHPNLAQFITDIANKIHEPYSLLSDPFAKAMKESSFPSYFQKGALAAVGFINENWDVLARRPSLS